MTASISASDASQRRIAAEAEALFQEQHFRLMRRTDRMFAGLMLLQWLAAIAAALWVSPRAWTGASSQLHLHVWLALGLGGAVASLPIYLALFHAGRSCTRYTIAVAQMLFSALLIHLTGGRIETHFHVFVSLAFLSVYRDWKVLIAATIVVAADHLLRGIFIPQSVYGVAVASPWRWLEHAGWVVFADIVLIYCCYHSIKEMQFLARGTAELAEKSLELQSASASNRAILDAALDAVVSMDLRGNIVGWNQQAEKLFDYKSDEAIGRPLHDLIIPVEYREAHQRGVANYVSNGIGPVLNRRVEVAAVRRDGKVFPVELSVVPVRMGEEESFSGFIRDITERQETERALLAAKEAAINADRAKSEFLANMSHEIRTPMNGILGFTRLLLSDAGELSEEDRRDYLTTVHQSGTHLLALVNDILDLSKIEAGRMDVEISSCSPGQIIAEVVSLLRARAQEKGLRLEGKCAGGVATRIETDPARLRQLLMNLVGNSVKFTQHGGIEIEGRFIHEGGRDLFRLEVADTGIGIPSERLEAIFDPFVQADNSVTRKHGGTGLGLAISRRITEALGGVLQVRSEVGCGTVFTADIEPGQVVASEPLNELKSVEVVRPKRAKQVASTGKLRGRVLVVDDGDTNRKLVSLMLRRAGAEVAEAENGQVGVDKALAEHFDVILMDMQMPVMDGYTATRRLRQTGMTTPIIALTAHAMKGDEEECRAAGCSDYVSKPIDMDALLETVAAAIRSRNNADSGSAPAPVTEPLISLLPTDDPEFCLIVREFHGRLREQLVQFRAHQAELEWESMGRIAHWLKGAGGTVGFPLLSSRAAELERAIKSRRADETESGIADLESMTARIVIEPVDAAC